MRSGRRSARACRAIGAHGAALLPDEGTACTHCNAGALATAGYGTALGVSPRGRRGRQALRVLCDETRPFLQGGAPHRLGACDVAGRHRRTRIIVDAQIAGEARRSVAMRAASVGRACVSEPPPSHRERRRRQHDRRTATPARRLRRARRTAQLSIDDARRRDRSTTPSRARSGDPTARSSARRRWRGRCRLDRAPTVRRAYGRRRHPRIAHGRRRRSVTRRWRPGGRPGGGVAGRAARMTTLSDA